MKCVMCEKDGARYRCRHCQSAYCSAACFKVHREEAAPRGETTESTSIAESASPSANAADTSTTLMTSCEYVMASHAAARQAAAEAEHTRALADLFSDVSLTAVMRDKSGSEAPRRGTTPTTVVTTGTATGPQVESLTPGDGDAVVASRKREREGDTTGMPGSANAQADRSELEPSLDEDANADARKRTRAATLALDDGADEDELTILREAHLRALANAASIRQSLKSDALQTLLRTIDSSRSRLDALEAALFNNPDFRNFCAEVKGTIALVEGERRRTH